MTSPLVSVVIPAYRSGPYLAETLDSVVRQTHGHREVIVVDDGSPGESVSRIVATFPSVRYLRQDHAGVGTARNTGIRAAAGDYIALLDHDDLWLPSTLEVQLAIAARHPESGLIACDGLQFDGDTILSPRLLGGPLATLVDAAPEGVVTGWFLREIVRYGFSCPAQTLIPRRVVDRVGPLITSREESTDFDYYLRIARDHPVTVHRHSLVRWRYLPGSRSGLLVRRPFEVALILMPVLKRHGRLGTPDDRAFLRQHLSALVRAVARALYAHAGTGDLAYARTTLRRLLRLMPGEPRIALALAATYVPDGLARGLARSGRRLAALSRLTANRR